MSIFTVNEKDASRTNRRGAHPAITVKLIVTGISTDDDAIAVVEGVISNIWDGWLIQWIEVTQDKNLPTNWDATCFFGEPQAAQGRGADVTYEFETTGGTQHILQSLQTTSSISLVAGVATAPNFNKFINVNEEGVAQGCEIPVPKYAWSEEHFFPGQQVTPAFRGALYFAAGKVNNAPFGDCKTGEALFLGAVGRRRGGPNGPDWSISYRFVGSPNATYVAGAKFDPVVNNMLLPNPMPGGSPAFINKKGWEYFWVYSLPSTIAVSVAGGVTVNVPKLTPIACYTEKVLNDADFSTLGIPTAAYNPSPIGFFVLGSGSVSQ